MNDKKAMQEAASNPELMKAVQERMQDPQVQQEMAVTLFTTRQSLREALTLSPSS